MSNEKIVVIPPLGGVPEKTKEDRIREYLKDLKDITGWNI